MHMHRYKTASTKILMLTLADHSTPFKPDDGRTSNPGIEQGKAPGGVEWVDDADENAADAADEDVEWIDFDLDPVEE